MKGTVFVLLLGIALSGRIAPKTTKPILPAYNNAGYTSDYTFNFQIETATFSASTLVIEFPYLKYN
jgi:hypothetical protein